MSDLALLLLLGILAALWIQSRRAQDIAVAHCRLACQRAGVQFLDDVAPVWRVRLARDAAGVLRLRRVYTFEYGTSLGERRRGAIVMLGRTPVAIHLDDIQDGITTGRFYP